MDTIPLSLPVLMDGATGTELYRRGMPNGVCTEQWVLEHPQALLEIQRAYVEAGSQVLIAPTFGANRVSLARHGAQDRVEEYNRRLVELTRTAADGRVLVAGDLAPTGLLLAPFGASSFEELVDVYAQQARALAAAGVDVRPFFPAQHGTPTRLHVALALVAGGFAPTIGEAFRNYLFRGTPGYVETKRILPEDAIALIHQAGGLAVLAHPCKVKADVAALVARLHPAGLDGLEAFYPTATPGQRDTYISMAQQYGMLLTCGSDFHGDNRPDNRLGCTWQQSPLLEPVYTWLLQRS